MSCLTALMFLGTFGAERAREAEDGVRTSGSSHEGMGGSSEESGFHPFKEIIIYLLKFQLVDVQCSPGFRSRRQ